MPGPTHEAGYSTHTGSSSAPMVLQNGLQLRLHSDGSGSSYDDFWFDRVHVACDWNGDGLPE